MLVALLLAWNSIRPVPAAAASLALPVETTVPGTPPALPWPGGGSAAVAVSGLGELATSGPQQPLPAASVTKVMTALVVLTDKPLAEGESGPVDHHHRPGRRHLPVRRRPASNRWSGAVG